MQLCNKHQMQSCKLHHLDITIYNPVLVCHCSIYCSLGTSYSAAFMLNY